jgi:hypothetical protein
VWPVLGPQEHQVHLGDQGKEGMYLNLFGSQAGSKIKKMRFLFYSFNVISQYFKGKYNKDVMIN